MATLSAHLSNPAPFDARTTGIAAVLPFVLTLGSGLAASHRTSRDATRIPAYGRFLIASVTLTLGYFACQLATLALIVARAAGSITELMIERWMRTR